MSVEDFAPKQSYYSLGSGGQAVEDVDHFKRRIPGHLEERRQ